MTIYIVLRLLAVLAVLLCVFLELSSLAFATVAIIVVYAILVGVRYKDDPTSLEFQADQVYFAAYLSTVAAFAGLIFRIYLVDGDIERIGISSILLITGIALATTVAGIFLMTYLKELSQRQGRGDASIEVSPEDMKRVLDTLQQTGVIRQLSGIMGQLSDISSGTQKTIVRVNEQLASLEKSIKLLKANVDNGALSANMFNENIIQLQGVLGEFVKLLETRIDLARPQSPEAHADWQELSHAKNNRRYSQIFFAQEPRSKKITGKRFGEARGIYIDFACIDFSQARNRPQPRSADKQ